MADIESLLNRWQSAGALDAEDAARIRAYEAGQQRPAGLRWQVLVALLLGAILLACGVVLFVSAHWEDMSPGGRYALVVAMLAMFHIGGGFAREKFGGLSTTLHGVGTVATGAAIALVGQIFNIQEHWPAAVLLWAVAALAGWALLRDQAQQILALLLVPAWMLSELEFHLSGHIGDEVYIGRFLLVWAVLYLTFFTGSRRRVAHGVLFAAGAVAAVTGIVFMLAGWRSWYGMSFVPSEVRFWGWMAIAAAPLVIAAFKGPKVLIPLAVAIGFAEALPWCLHLWTQYYTLSNGTRTSYSGTEPNLAAHALVLAFTVFLIWWGVHMASKALVNYGVVGFAVAVGWFYFSNIFDKVGRSLGLIGLGILFLAGGWALEMTRRRLVAHMAQSAEVPAEAR